MNPIKLTFVLLLLFMLFACSSTLATPEDQLGPTETYSPARLPQETRTSTPPTPTITPTASLTETAETGSLENPIKLTTIALESVGANGFLVLERRYAYASGHLIYDIKNKQVTEAIDFYYGVSPNRKFMLTGTCPGEKCHYILRTAEKIINANIPTEVDWVIARWLDNERVVVLRFRRDQWVIPQDIAIYDLFTGKQTSLRLNLPNIYIECRATYPMCFVDTSLNPSLEQVAFNDQDGSLVLWNLDTQVKVASLPFADRVSRWSSDGWSPDGRKFITTSPNESQWTAAGGPIPPTANELFLLDVDGNITQLTHYNQQYPFANIEGPSWSPDNRHIAFQLTISDNASNTRDARNWLAILDTSTMAIKIYNVVLTGSGLVWSPDGRQLIIENQDRSLTLVDLAHETQSPIPNTQSMRIRDWMAP